VLRIRYLVPAVIVLAGVGAAVLHFVSGDGGARTQAAAVSKPRSVAPVPHRSRTVRHRHVHGATSAAQRLGLPPVEPGPVPGYVLIADRNANKLLIVSPSKRIVWQFPRPGDVRAGESFFDPDDAFFTPGFRRIVTNEEFNDSVAQIDIRRHRIVWAYGRAGVAGSSAGELSNPDDAYVWPNGTITVADIKNCRVLRLDRAKRIVAEVGSAGRCAHDPPRSLSSPNGATPLRDGGMMVTEIGGWVDRLDARGRLVYAVRTPTTYPSDAQLLPSGNVLVAGFDTPGRVDEITPKGRIVWTYGPVSGPGALDRPSLAVRWPNGMIAITDDWHHRILVVDPRTNRIVWQYGHFGEASSAPGYLSKPDGLDLLPSSMIATARHATRRTLHVTTIGRLPRAASRLAAAALPDGRILAAGGLVAGTSSDQILFGRPSRLRVVGRLPSPTHDAALADGYLFGGGEAVSTDAVIRIDPQARTARRAGTIGEPLSDLGAATIGTHVYLVGGYTGSRFATAVLRYRPGRPPVVVARLPAGLRYAGVAALGGRIYVAGGVTPSGESATVLAVDPLRHTVRTVVHLPSPVAHAPLATLHGALYLVGGTDTSGTPRRTILRIHRGSVAVAGYLPTPLADAAAVSVGGRIVILGGSGTIPSARVLAFH
jgi:Kelch motif protein